MSSEEGSHRTRELRMDSDLKIVGELSYNPTDIIGRGGFAIVFHGLYRNSLPVAVKRKKKRPFWNDSDFYQQLYFFQVAQHPNILRCFGAEMDDVFSYIFTELCEGTLQDYIEEAYRGPKFNGEREMLHQLTKGVAYLHENNIAHRDIKPTNILIFSPGDRSRPKLKLDIPSTEEMTEKEDFTNTSATNQNGRKGWMAPEMYECEQNDFKVDIFPLGCVFAYTLSGGKHPFGNDTDGRMSRIQSKRPMLLNTEDLKMPYCDEHPTFALIESMLEVESSKRPSAEEVLNHAFFNVLNIVEKAQAAHLRKVDGQLSYYFSGSKEHLLGKGGFALVFLGLWKDPLLGERNVKEKKVAVKRIQRDPRNDSFQKVADLILKVIIHPNILQCFSTHIDEYFLYIVTELCEGTLQDYIKKRYSGPNFNDEREMLHQLTKAVAYLHGNNIVHRDIKPTQILIYLADDRSKPQIKLNISRIAKSLKAGREDFTNTSTNNPSGTPGWIAPEMYFLERFDFKVDIWALGCVFVYTLTAGGKHPFDYEKNTMLLTIEDLKIPYCDDISALFELIQSMLEAESSKRPSAKEVLSNFFFKDLNVAEISKVVTSDLKKVDDHLSYYFCKEHILGRGGNAMVFRGIWKNPSADPLILTGGIKERNVAVKRIQIDPSGESNFQKEVDIILKVKDKHPNILKCFSRHSDDFFWFIVTELCKGTLKEWMEGKYQGPPIGDERNILFQVTDALAYLHDNNIVHRDIKPSNILISIPEVEGGEPMMKLADFGISKILTKENGCTNTNVDNPSGSSGYIAPELNQFNRFGFEIDIYSLGVVFGQVLSKERKNPFDITSSVGAKLVLKQEDIIEPYSNDGLAFELIKSMVNVKSEDRPKAQNVLENPFFHPMNMNMIKYGLPQ